MTAFLHGLLWVLSFYDCLFPSSFKSTLSHDFKISCLYYFFSLHTTHNSEHFYPVEIISPCLPLHLSLYFLSPSIFLFYVSCYLPTLIPIFVCPPMLPMPSNLHCIGNSPRFHFSKSLKLHWIEIWNLSWFSKQIPPSNFIWIFLQCICYIHIFLCLHISLLLCLLLIRGQILSPWLRTKNLGTWVCCALLVSCVVGGNTPSPPTISPLNSPRKSNFFSHERTMIHYVG
jgi:hypothetical protein